MADTTTMVLLIYSVLVSWTYILLVILIIAKIIQFFTGGSLLGRWGRRGRDRPDSDDRRRRSDPDEDRKREKTEREKFEEGIENPAELRVWVRNEDDENVQAADVTIYAKKHRGETKLGPNATNKDGLYPATGEFLKVPSGVPIRINVIYWLDRAERYKARKRSWTTLWITPRQKRKFTAHDNITLTAGEQRTHEVKLPFKSEYPIGFEPFIIFIDTESEPGRIKTKAIIKSTTGR